MRYLDPKSHSLPVEKWLTLATCHRPRFAQQVAACLKLSINTTFLAIPRVHTADWLKKKMVIDDSEELEKFLKGPLPETYTHEVKNPLPSTYRRCQKGLIMEVLLPGIIACK